MLKRPALWVLLVALLAASTPSSLSRALIVDLSSRVEVYQVAMRAKTGVGSAGSSGGSDKHRSAGPVLVTGATGRTGSLVYAALRDEGIQVRALVRNVTKAREVLLCDECDASEGIFVGDVTNPATLIEPMRGARRLVILTGSYPLMHPNGSWYFPEGEYPRDVDWRGSGHQVKAALRAGVQHVLLVSSMGTTEPDSFLDKMGDGHALFYKLNGEADLMASGLPFTIVKPGGLLNSGGGEHLLLAGHNDDMEHARVSRADVAAVLVAAILHPRDSTNLRFDLSTDPQQPATNDFRALFDDARAWNGKAKP